MSDKVEMIPPHFSLFQPYIKPAQVPMGKKINDIVSVIDSFPSAKPNWLDIMYRIAISERMNDQARAVKVSAFSRLNFFMSER